MPADKLLEVEVSPHRLSDRLGDGAVALGGRELERLPLLRREEDHGPDEPTGSDGARPAARSALRLLLRHPP